MNYSQSIILGTENVCFLESVPNLWDEMGG